MKIKKLPNWFYFLAALFLRLIRILFYKRKITDPYGNVDINKLPYITVHWHNRSFLYVQMFDRNILERTYALISISRDGQHMASMVKQFGVNYLKGSSSKRAAGAVMEAMELLEKGYNIDIAPDGPRGPRYKCHQGAIILASKTGYPILPMGVNYSKYWELDNWCKYRIPKPFSTAELSVGQSIKIPPDLTREEIDKWCRYVEEKINEVSQPL